MKQEITQKHIDIANKILKKYLAVVVKNYYNLPLEKKKIEKNFNFCIALNKRLFRDFLEAKNQKKLF